MPVRHPLPRAQVPIQSERGLVTEGHLPRSLPFADDIQDPLVQVDVSDLQSHQLPSATWRRHEQPDDRRVPPRSLRRLDQPLQLAVGQHVRHFRQARWRAYSSDRARLDLTLFDQPVEERAQASVPCPGRRAVRRFNEVQYPILDLFPRDVGYRRLADERREGPYAGPVALDGLL